MRYLCPGSTTTTTPTHPQPTPKAITVCIAVSDDAGRLLMIERTDNGNVAPTLRSLGARRDPARTAIRECQEETGYLIEITDLIGTFSDPGVVADYQTATPEVRQECTDHVRRPSHRRASHPVMPNRRPCNGSTQTSSTRCRWPKRCATGWRSGRPALAAPRLDHSPTPRHL